MSKRKFLLGSGLAAAVFGPIALTSPEMVTDQAKALWKSWTSETTARPALSTTAPGTPPIGTGNSALPGGVSPYGSTTPFTPGAGDASLARLSPPAYPLADVMRFDLSPSAVVGRWPHVLTMTGSTDFQGYRVPLVTGTREEDLAGTLTYYFAPSPEMRRLTFSGVTGDPAELVALVTQRFGFQQQTSPEPGVFLYQIRYRGRPNSQLTLRMHDTIRSDRPLRRFSVDLEVNLPDVQPSRPLIGDTKPAKGRGAKA